MNENQSDNEFVRPPQEGGVCPGPASGSATDRAAGAVALAEAELKRAKEAYDRVYDDAIRRIREVREAKVGDLCDEVLEKVKRCPGTSLFVAGLLGFFFGRLFRR